MSAIGTLWTPPNAPPARTSLATAAFAGLKVDLPQGYTHKQDNKRPEFLSKFPHGKIPAFEGKDGFKLFEGSAISRYFASLAPNAGLLGGDLKEQALVEQWAHFAEYEIYVPATFVNHILRGELSPYNKSLHTTYTDRIVSSLATLDQHLHTRTFLVHERITLADIATASAIHRAVPTVYDKTLREKYPNVLRHFETVANQSKIKQYFLPIEYIEKPLQYVAPKKEKEAKPAAAPAPKAEKKPKAKPADDEEDEPSAPPEPKAKNPLDDLPKSSFNLEDWKRAYSNKDTRGPDGAIEWFYQNFDKDGFSVWRVDFKYNEELTQTFMSSNQIGGFFNRLEASRKYLFASVGVLGTSNDSIIAGVLILRGPEARPVVEVAPDWESYSYTKLDLSDAAQKEFFEGALAWDLEVNGKKWVDGKNFK